jgi:hypothetical protein
MYLEISILTGHEHEYMGNIHQKALFNSHYVKKQEYTNKMGTNEDPPTQG